MKRARAITVFGSAHLDILARTTEGPETVDKIGRIDIDLGGTGFNIARGLSYFGGGSTLVTALRPSLFTQLILKALDCAGTSYLVLSRATLPLSGFSAHLSPSGDLLSAISSTSVEHAVLPRNLIDKGLARGQGVIADCNWTPAVLSRIASRARAHGKPLFLAGVSEIKSRRLIGLARHAQGCFFNRREFGYLAAVLGVGSEMRSVAAHLGSVLYITDGPNGVFVATRDGVEHIPALKPMHQFSQVGLGDLFCGLAVYGLTLGMAPDNAVRFAMNEMPMAAEHVSILKAQLKTVESQLDAILEGAEVDPLTGLMNRRAMLERIQAKPGRRANEQSPATVILMDIDHFKRVNDSLGHDAGDRVLRWLGQYLKELMRDGDLVARWGGEEFLVVLPGTAKEPGTMVAERIRSGIENRSREAKSLPTSFTASLGVAEMLSTESFEDAVKLADKGLYAAKEQGRNRVVALDSV